MPGTFYVTGIIEPSHHGRSFKVYALAEGKKVFVGLISRQDLARLLRLEISVADICMFSQNASEEQESLSGFSVDLGGTKH